MFDELVLLVNNRKISGWMDIRVTRGIERCPSDFEIEMTDIYPGEIGYFPVIPGDFCQVFLGDDIVITGYVDRVSPSIDKGRHEIRVTGRGKCADLVDCAAEWPGGQINGSVLAIAQKLAEPYGLPDHAITIRTDVDDISPVINQFNLMLGETAFEIIERICRYTALLAYDEPDGNLLLTRAGKVTAASGFQIAESGDTSKNNVQSASITYSMDQRFSEVLAFIQSFDTFIDLGENGNLISTITDPNVPRHRRKIVIAEAGDDSSFTVTKRRAEWEVSRRSGRSRTLKLITDSWRDIKGKLWTPNTLVPLYLPSLRLNQVSWLISEVSYKRDISSGTTAELTIMPPEAFLPQPLVYQPTYSDVPTMAGQ